MRGAFLLLNVLPSANRCIYSGVNTMSAFMKRYESQIYALLRIVVGFLFFWHGTQKLFSFPQAAPDAPLFVIYIAGTIELVGGALIAVGFLTRWAAFLSSGLMAAAYWIAHGLNHPLPQMNGGELPAVYCFVFLFICAHGAGIWSVDGSRGADGETG
jgi:putative oxidoreductase